jgi:hypothetical protein
MKQLAKSIFTQVRVLLCVINKSQVTLKHEVITEFWPTTIIVVPLNMDWHKLTINDSKDISIFSFVLLQRHFHERLH